MDVDIDEQVAVAVNADVYAHECIALAVGKAVDVNPGVDILEGGVKGEEGGLAMHGGASPFQNVHAIHVHCMSHYSLNWCNVLIYVCMHAFMYECMYL